jgi:hypothetical protein
MKFTYALQTNFMTSMATYMTVTAAYGLFTARLSPLH